MSKTSGAAHSASATMAVTAGSTGKVVSSTASPEATGNSTSPAPPTNANVPTNSSNSFNCHRTYAQWKDGVAGPFCEPLMYQDVWVGREYSVIWDPSAFNHSSNSTVSLKYVDDSEDGGFARWWQTVPNERGYVEIAMDQEWLMGQPRNNLSLWITTVANDGNQTETAGPIISLVEPPTASASPLASQGPATPAPHKPSNKVGMAVGIPIGLAFMSAIFAGLFLVMRKRRQGYVGSQSRGQGTIHLTGDEFRTTRRRGDSFKDEPLQSVELQPRNGNGRRDSIGNSMGSPPNDSRREGSNVFRDEIARQRAGDHRPRR